AVLTAHYGVVLAQLHAWLGTRHFGGPEYFIAQYGRLDVIVHTGPGGYYALLAVTKPTPPLGFALVRLREAVLALPPEVSLRRAARSPAPRRSRWRAAPPPRTSPTTARTISGTGCRS